MNDDPSVAEDMKTVTERRGVQRDWLGHGLQLGGILIVLGLPIMFWGISLNTTVAMLSQQVARQERDTADQKQVQVLITNQMLDVSKQLTRIDTQLEGIRNQFRLPKR